MYQVEDVRCCPVHILYKYMSLLPSGRKCTALNLQQRSKYSDGNWFLDRPVGINKLSGVVSSLCKKANLPGFYTNHSLHATCATRMYQGNVDEQLICEVTGHRSVSVRSHKCTGQGQRKVANAYLSSQQSEGPKDKRPCSQ